MSNKSTGTTFEREFVDILAEHWFWVHLFQDNKNGQPCDVIACKNGQTYLFDCKDCQDNIFLLSRIEENQYNAMHLFDLTGNGVGMFAIRFPGDGIYLIDYVRLEELQNAGFKRINSSIGRSQGCLLRDWLNDKEGKGNIDANHNWK